MVTNLIYYSRKPKQFLEWCNTSDKCLILSRFERTFLKRVSENSPLHLNISMHILYNVLYTFLEGLTRRTGLMIKSFSN